ncbi:PspC domain-containing protein [Pseudobacteriovorax antillogorgiicola]|uniref:Phage shock protein C (PspC) family protein n=1 Tax=Pseudobacteriovorax antillogorgiicola TaxID=1513793 RepID=A0A1Y6BX04_9BACT|nr:PspC domain-containing protein [Pseudobacteriovorax antillogorgiicola]TCS53139.1 phage shock protein C (PspC) family protein [Pseudobacteriovorax antillogorgiicola]SMF25288.1 phage shock protein C (PspC) family protein [Pseudobacteriovorax antillogorgiicola]
MEYQTITVSPEIDRHKWVRSSDGILAGVSGGIAKSFGIDPWIVRLVWAVAFLAFGTGLFAYVLLAVSLPREDRLAEAYEGRLLGVCARVASRLNLEVGLARFFALLLAIMSFGVTLVGYLILHFVLENQNSYRGKVTNSWQK